MPITFITDRLPGEPEILAPIRHHSLRIQDLEGKVLANLPCPPGGWTHELLVGQVETLSLDLREGADAYLGDDWVGGTEV